jgi:hypothetical protein
MTTSSNQLQTLLRDGRVIRAVIIALLGLIVLFYLARVTGIITSSRRARLVFPQTIRVRGPEPVEVSVNSSIIYPGETIVTALGVGELHAWRFEAGKEDIADIVVQPNGEYDAGFNPVLELFGPDGTSLARVDEQPGNGAELLVGFPLRETGEYTIWVSDAEYSHGGGYQLTALTTRAKYTYPLRIGIGQLATGELQRDQYNHWLFAGRAGQEISLSVLTREGTETSSGFRPIVDLHAPDGSRVARINAPAPLAPAIGRNITLPLDGDYTVWIHADSFDQHGLYIFSVQYTRNKADAE